MRSLYSIGKCRHQSRQFQSADVTGELRALQPGFHLHTSTAE